MNKSVIIVAAGTGSRMGSNIPKQFISLNGIPVLMHTISRFHEYDKTMKIIVVLSANETERWKSLSVEHNFKVPHVIVNGGDSRTSSVINGLEKIQDGIVGIHDGVRPLISINLIKRCFEEAGKNSNAIPAIPVVDTIRETIDDNSRMIDRTNLRQVQTPQCFDAIKLKKAYQSAGNVSFTDDAAVFEKDGNKIHLVPGEKINIKITDPDDLRIAEALLK